MDSADNMDQDPGGCGELMTCAEIATFLRRSRSWVYQNLQSLPHHTVPGFRGAWFDKNEIVRWVKTGGVHESTTGSRDAAFTDLAAPRATPYHRKARNTEN
jgi:hypothetical protein